MGIAAMKFGLKIAEKQNEKGSLGNRIEYASKQAINYRKTAIKDEFASAAGVAASVAAAAGVAHSKTAQNVLTKGFNYVKNSNFGQSFKNVVSDISNSVKPYAKKAVGWVSGLPKPAKAVLAIGLGVTTLVSGAIRAKGNYNAGKIDQLYTDKAKLEKELD